MAVMAETGAESVEWDLGDLYSGPDDPAYARETDEVAAAARAFRERYEGKVASLDANGLLELVRELERIVGLAYKVQVFANFLFDAEASEERGGFVQGAEERYRSTTTDLLFFDVEWGSLDDAVVDRLLSDPALADYRYALASRRRFRPHLLSSPEERIAAEKAITGIDTWRRLNMELLSRIRVDLDGQDVSTSEALARLETVADRDERRRASEAVGTALDREIRMRAFVINTVVNDRAVEDRLRGYPTWISAFNLEHRISDDAVDALVKAVTSRYDIAQRHLRLRARLLGLDRLATYDQVAPTGGESPAIPWEDAHEIVVAAYNEFSPAAGEIVGRFFDESWIDAAIRPGKTVGAYCARPWPDGHPYILMNYAGARRDVTTLAHELGHGLHGVLSSPHSYLNRDIPLTIAETASVLGESLTYELLRQRETDERSQLDILVSQVDGLTRTVFMPIAGNRFENALHTTRRAEGELSVDRINALWVQSMREWWGDEVEDPDERAAWWSMYPHFVFAPGYMYPYAFGLLLSFSIYRRWTQERSAFADAILDFLRAGASRPPEELVRELGFDLADPQFWNSGLDAIEALVGEAEQLAERVA
jgi:oligoendopeptidase F